MIKLHFSFLDINGQYPSASNFILFGFHFFPVHSIPFLFSPSICLFITQILLWRTQPYSPLDSTQFPLLYLRHYSVFNNTSQVQSNPFPSLPYAFLDFQPLIFHSIYFARTLYILNGPIYPSIQISSSFLVDNCRSW